MMQTIMIVENESIERDALKLFLNKNFKHSFNKIIEAKNGAEAIKNSKIYNPDLIIMNIEIPQINGIDVQKEILSFLPKINTIFISTHSSFEYAQQALKLNVKDYLLKPVRFSTLKDSINKIISNISKNDLKDNSYLHLNKSQSDITKKAIIYMNNNFQKKITLESIASEIHINSQYLSRLFKKEIGISYSDYLNTLRINKACSLLVNTSYTNYRIAVDSGFTDSAYFSKVFTKHIKITPSKYRKMHLDNKYKILSSKLI